LIPDADEAHANMVEFFKRRQQMARAACREIEFPDQHAVSRRDRHARPRRPADRLITTFYAYLKLTPDRWPAAATRNTESTTVRSESGKMASMSSAGAPLAITLALLFLS
jgi:hypothetical protein